MDNITVIILLAVVIVLIFISLFFMYSIKNSIKKSINKEIESINKDNDNKLNSKLQENTFEIKEKFQEVLFEIQKGFTKDVGELKKEVSDNMISNLERTQTAATGNIKVFNNHTGAATTTTPDTELIMEIAHGEFALFPATLDHEITAQAVSADAAVEVGTFVIGDDFA